MHEPAEQTVEKPFPSPEEIFLSRGLYDVIPHTSSDVEQLLRFKYFEDTVDSFCLGCNLSAAFRAHSKLADNAARVQLYVPERPKSDPQTVDKEGLSGLLKYCDNVKDLIREVRNINKPVHPMAAHLANEIEQRNLLFIALQESYFGHTLVCQRNRSHEIRFWFYVDRRSLIKVGQIPSIADLATPDKRRFSKILGQERQAEYNRGVGLHAHGVGIGSFVYMRRILEDLVEEAHQQASREPGWNDEEYQRGRMAERIKLLRDYLPPFLVEHATLYSIVSEGIHGWHEQQCLDLFPVVKAGVDHILTEKLRQKEDEARRRQASQDIQNIRAKYGG
jgi:hypothetical protein